MHAITRHPRLADRWFLILVTACCLVSAPVARAAGLLEPGCNPADQAGPSAAGETCGGPVAVPNGVYLFSGEFFHTAVDMRIRGRGMDFVWTRTYRSRVSPNIGMGAGWTHSYDIRLVQLTAGPSEARNLRFPGDSTTLEWDPPLMPAGDVSRLRYCTLRSDDPSNFSSATTRILDPEDTDTMTLDTDVPLTGQLFAYLILPRNGTRSGPLGTDSDGIERLGRPCGNEAPELVLHDGTGRTGTYRLLSPGLWTTPEFFRELTQPTLGGGYVLTFPDTGTWNFRPFDGSPSAGRIESIVDRNGNTIAFDYDGLGRLDTITDTLGRDIVVGYDGNGFLSSVTDFTGRQVQYDYYPAADPNGSFDDLRSATSPAVGGTPNGNDFPDGKRTVYTYSTGFSDPNLNHNLLTITDPKGQQFLHNVYATTTDPGDLDYDRIVEQHWGDPDDVIHYAYFPQTPVPLNVFAELLTIENDRAGNVTEYQFDGRNRNVMVREYTGRAPDPAAPTTITTNRPTNRLRPADPGFFETRWSYNDESRAEQVVLMNGSRIFLTYDGLNPDRRSQGNVRARCRESGPLGGDQTRICETFDYDDGPAGTNFVTREVDGRHNETQHVYDAAGNRMRTTHRIPTIIEEFDYNEFGQLIEHTWPDNGSGHLRRDIYTYYAAGPQNGYRESVVLDGVGEALTTVYEYDARGNIVRTVDPRGNDTQWTYNALDQVVRETDREAAPGVPRYQTDLFYDANDNVVRIDRLNVDETGVVSANPQWTTIHEYDVLDEMVRKCREARPYSGAIPGTPGLPTCDGLPGESFIVEEYEYDANRNRTLVREGEATNGNDPDNVRATEYDERDLRFRDVRAPGSADPATIEYQYDLTGNLAQVSRGLESGTPDMILYRYDGYDRLVSTEDPMGNQETFEYDANGNVVREIRIGELEDVPGGTNNLRLFEAGNVYDELDRLRSRTIEHFESDSQNPILDGQVLIQVFWSDSSHLIQTIDDRDNPTTYEYDSVNRLSSVTDARGNTMRFEYDSNSNVIHRATEEQSDQGAAAQVFVTTYDYDGLNRPMSLTDSVGNTRRSIYDSRDNRILGIDALTGGVMPPAPGNVVRHRYDGLNRLVRTERILTTNGTGSGTPVDQVVTQQVWDDSDRLAQQIDDNGNVTTYLYDSRGNRVQIDYGDGTSRTLGYDLDDDPVKVIDPNGSSTSITRDANRRIVSRTIVPGSGIAGTTFETLTHDGLNRVVRAEEDESVVEMRYDSLGRIIEDTQNGQPVRTLWDGVGNRLETTYPGGRTIQRTYDVLNRLDEVIEGMDPLAQYDWVGPGRVEARFYGNGTKTGYEYDGIVNSAGDFGVKRVVRTTHSGPGGTIDDRVYAYDPMSNKILAQDLTPGGVGPGTGYTYDSLHRLVVSERFDSAGPVGTTQYGLDGLTNRTTVAGGLDPGTYFMDPTSPVPSDQQVNQYTQTSFDSREYDENGNLIRIDAGTASQRDAVYDYRDRMVQYADASTGVQVNYEYDVLGRRIARIESSVAGGGTETRYFYDGWQVCEEQDGVGTTQATYVYGVDLDEVLTMQRGGNDYFFHGDEQLSVVAVTDGSGNVVERYSYEDYGEPHFLTGTGAPLGGSAVGNPYLFAGRRFDGESGWYYLRTRYLDPRAGRFTTRDTLGPWGDGSAMGNGYTYAGGNPATHRDPLGEMIFVKIPKTGDHSIQTYESGKWFVADSFSFGIEREMKESGEKGGTGDINIGVGELQECTVSKSMDWASPKLAQFAINGNSPGTSEIDFVETAGSSSAAGEAKPICYLKYKLDRCIIKSWSISGDADDRPTEEVAFYYNKIAFAYASGRSGQAARDPMGWDNTKHTKWSSATSGDADDRPTEEVAFYYNKIAFRRASTTGFLAGDEPLVPGPRYLHGVGSPLASTWPVEREMKESGEKGGTEDINIGVGELQECTVSKSMDL